MKKLGFFFAIATLLVVSHISAQDCVVPDDGTGTVDLPPADCPYLSPDEFHMIIDGLPPGTEIRVAPIHRGFLCNGNPQHCGTPGGSLGGETERFESTLVLQMTGTGELEDFNRTISLPITCETHTAPRTPGAAVQTFQTDMFQLQGQLIGDPDFAQLQVIGGAGFGLPSPGQTTLTELPDGRFNVDSFFDITYQIDFVGAPGGALAGLAGSTLGTVNMRTGEPAPPEQICVVEDNGTGTVNLPPPGCGYLSPNDLHMMIDGLPPGTTIEIDPIHQRFFCPGGPNQCGTPGGALGGFVETFDSTLTMTLRGTGALNGFVRNIDLPVACVTHTGPRDPGDPVQCFPNDMFRLQGEIFGDPDFELLRVTAGSDFGLPSPGATTLTRLPSGDFNVDSFFDIEYRIEFQGAPGGALDGLAGTTQSRVRMQAGTPAKVEHPCLGPDDGTGTVNLPPEDCPYLSPDEVHMIINGLPPGTTIELDPIHQNFICTGGGPNRCGTQGGALGGEVEQFDSTLTLKLNGTGALAGFKRQVTVPIACITHTGPRDPLLPIQTFQTDMFRLEGGISGDPDFASLTIQGGTDFGLPSPGQTRLTRLPDNDFVVDSFFDITYQIDFQGAPGGALDGMSGSTQATVRMQAGDQKPHQRFYPLWPLQLDVRDILIVIPPPSIGTGR